MFRTPPGLVPIATLLVLMIAACSNQLRKSTDAESSYLIALRGEYLAANPDGQYNEFVKRGEVIKGMDFLAVLASWGHPTKRTKKTYTTEMWTYKDIDEDSKDWIEYTFTFHENVLSEWQIARHTASGGRLEAGTRTRDTRAEAVLKRGKRIPNE